MSPLATSLSLVGSGLIVVSCFLGTAAVWLSAARSAEDVSKAVPAALSAPLLTPADKERILAHASEL